MHGGRRRSVIGGAALVSALVAVASTLAPPASAVPAPEVEYVYNVIVRRHFDFPNNDALGYGFALCDKVNRGVPYAVVMGDVKRDVLPNDEKQQVAEVTETEYFQQLKRRANELRRRSGKTES